MKKLIIFLKIKKMKQSKKKILIEKFQKLKRIFLWDLLMMKIIKKKNSDNNKKSGNLKNSFEFYKLFVNF
jgi:hypothetical protein